MNISAFKSGWKVKFNPSDYYRSGLTFGQAGTRGRFDAYFFGIRVGVPKFFSHGYYDQATNQFRVDHHLTNLYFYYSKYHSAKIELIGMGLIETVPH